MSEIPPITDPMGNYWAQPSRSEILVDDKHAVMSKADFAKLAEYSSTMPSGVYDGKMWRRYDGFYDEKCKPADRRWLLCWYGPSDSPGRCSINFREILVLS